MYFKDKTFLSEKKLFEKLFLKIRRYYQADIKSWFLLNPLTRFGEFLQNNCINDFYVVTTKDKKSVELLLDYYKIECRSILAKDSFDKYGSKGKVINSILSDINSNEPIFVDDSSRHLDSVNSIGRIKCYFADWGYERSSPYPVFNYSKLTSEKRL